MISDQAAPDLLVILPTFNEKDNVPILIDDILNLPNSEKIKIIVVDDDSLDLTWDIVSKKYHGNQRVSVLRREGRQRGLVHSLNEAIAGADTDLILWMDADLQMSAKRIPDFISAYIASQPTAVIGSRYLPGGRDIRHKGKVGNKSVIEMHRWLSGALSRFVPLLLGIASTDVTSGFILIKRNFFNSYKLKGSHGEYFIHLLCELQKGKHPIVEIPYSLTPRINGVSKSTGGRYFPFARVGLRYLVITVLLIFRKK